MMQKLKLFIWPLLTLAAVLIWLLIAGERDSEAVRAQVVRYHVVANSDSKEDQQIKILLRDRLFESIGTLFEDCADAEAAIRTAEANRARLEAEGEQYLRSIGVEDEVSVTVGPCFFPTKSYGSLSFPPGEYQAVRVTVGEGRGENFWCVLYPALCLSPAVSDEEGEEKMAIAVGEEATAFLQKEGQIRSVKFRLVEWFEQICHKIKNS